MSRRLWRIATDTPTYEADDLSGAGAMATGGRWNAPEIPLLYAAETIALACLETIVHLDMGGLPFNRFLVAMDAPDDLWSCAQVETVESLRVGWDAEPAGRVSIAFGSEWARSGASAILRVPSVIAPEEGAVLINPKHPGVRAITATEIRRWLYDPRLGKGSSGAA